MPARSIHQTASATSGGSHARNATEQNGSTPEGAGCSSRAACTFQFFEHVPDRVGGLGRRSQQLCVVAVRKHRALPAHHLVEGARHPDFQPFHRPAQRLRVGGLDDEVRVVPLH